MVSCSIVDLLGGWDCWLGGDFEALEDTLRQSQVVGDMFEQVGFEGHCG